MFHIVVDSTTDHIREYEAFTVVPLYVNVKGKFFKDRIELSREEFYKMLPDVIDDLGTSQPNPEDFREAFENAPESEILVLTISSKLSGTIQSALAAAKEVKKKVVVFDTLNVSLGAGILTHIAAELRSQGKTIEEVVEKLTNLRDQVRFYAMVATVKNFVRRGRISAFKGFMAELMHVVPVVHVKDGFVVAYHNERGAAFEVLKKYLEKFKDFINSEFPLVIGYTDPSEKLTQLAEQWSAYLVRATPLVGGFVGNNSYGFAFVEGASE
ncbi:DegV family protein [Coprothermobacteraceae bacterium]|nr:DegV family protein [Coprothermobacteraceae bacterium]